MLSSMNFLSGRRVLGSREQIPFQSYSKGLHYTALKKASVALISSIQSYCKVQKCVHVMDDRKYDSPIFSQSIDFLLNESHALSLIQDKRKNEGNYCGECAYTQVDRHPILFIDYFMLTSRIWCPSRRPAFSASDPVLTELMKLPLSLPPTRVISELRLSPFSVTRWIVWQEFLMRPTDVTEGRKGLCS